jgi:hypothetical protein
MTNTRRAVRNGTVRPDHDHACRPFVWLTPNEADLRRTTLTRGEATLLSSHAGDPRTAAGDTSSAGQAKQPTQSSRVSPPPARGPTGRVGRHRPSAKDDDSDRSLAPLGPSPPIRHLRGASRRPPSPSSRPPTRSSAFSQMQGRRDQHLPQRSGNPQISEAGAGLLRRSDVQCAASRSGGWERDYR